MTDGAVSFFQALGDRTRLDLLELLGEGERTVGDLVEALGCPQPKVSRHLKVLKEVGLVQDRRDGRNVLYVLATSPAWSPGARAWLDRLAEGLPLRERRPSSPQGSSRERLDPGADGAGPEATGAGAATTAGAAATAATATIAGARTRPPARSRELEPWLL